MSFVIRSGQVSSGTIGNAAVVSGSIGSGQICSGHLASGLIAGLQSGGANLVSGQVTSGFLGDASVVSGSVASGQISDLHFASGANINEANWVAFSGMIAGELISGVKAVEVGSGGLVFRTGFPLSAPVIYGLVADNVASGTIAKVYTHGPVFAGAISGTISGKAGAVITWNAVGFIGFGGNSPLGVVLSGSVIHVNAPLLTSGVITTTQLASGAVNQGQIAAGAVTPSTIASGVVVDTALQIQAGGTSGAFNEGGPFIQTSQAISGIRAVSFDTATATVHFSQIRIAQAGIPATMPAFGIVIDNVVSGDFVNAHTHGYVAAPQFSGLVSGHNGQPIYVNTSGDLSITQPTNSGALVQAIGVAVHDVLFGNLFGIELVSQPWSGSISSFQLGSGAILSGSLGSGQVSQFAISSGAVNSGQISPNTVISGVIASGTIGHFHISSGGVEGQGLSGIPSNIASGSIGANDLRQSIITHGHLDVGANAPFTNTMAYGVAIGPGNLTAGQAQMSGGAVAFISLPGNAGQLTIVPAERNSGLRLPAIGVMASGAGSGQAAVVVTQGFVPSNFFIASGFINQPLYVGSGGFIVTQSGGLATAFSGAGPGQPGSSGGGVQRIGVVVSGGMWVQVDMQITSGLNSTPVGTF